MRLLLLDIERNLSVEGTSMLVDQGLRLNAYNFFEGQRRHSSRLSTVVLCGTPCRSRYKST